MFTGIVEETGIVSKREPHGDGIRFTIRARKVLRGLGVDNSICVNGTCLTVVGRTVSGFSVEAVRETLRKTTLGAARVGSTVNLERPVPLGGRLGGHLVQGHIDATGTVARRHDLEASWMFSIRFPSRFRRYLIPVGSIAVDGVSLTVAALHRSTFEVAIIPYTMEHTIFGTYRAGTRVNLEFDMVGKYVESLLGASRGQIATIPAEIA